MNRLVLLIAMLSLGASSSRAAEAVGQRPYEMEWAGRTSDDHPPLIDFESLEGWTVECKDAEATLTRSRTQQLWGEFVGELTYKMTGTNERAEARTPNKNPVITIKPPRPVPLPADYDCINFWAYGNTWAWAPDSTTPNVTISLILRGANPKPVRVTMATVRWKEWWVMHRRLTPEQLAALGPSGALEAIEVTGGRNTQPRTIFFDNLSVYKEALPPLKFEPRPQRNLTLFPGQTAGANNGPGRLPFPTREETILPDNLAEGFNISLEQSGDLFAFHYRGKDGHLIYEYRPASGTLGDLQVQWEGLGVGYQPLAGGGIALAGADGKPAPPDKIERLGCRREGDAVVSRWRCGLGAVSTEVQYRMRLWQKSLVIDVICPGGQVGEVRAGHAVGAENPRLVTLPYLTGDTQRPAVLVQGPPERPLFSFLLFDYYRSNASELWAENKITPTGVSQNGGARYTPKTDGKRNDCFERLFLTVSPRFEEILPNIPNPKSPWMEVTGERVWRSHGATNREADYAKWKQVARYGMSKILITDHEVGWRDGGESFTFRTKAAPGKGGDAGQAEYARKIHALGFRYGIYNNYTDFAPVNEFWNEDMVTRLPDGQWRTAWARCYNPKPARAVEYEARLAPIIQQKFHLDTAYCDVHTCVRPWANVDFDARVPGAGTFAATYYAYGEIMLHQKKTWGGPVYSEGNNHWFYCGVVDGNYGQDQAAKLSERPWLVDFDLRKLHPLCCNFGMGNPGMFYGKEEGLGKTPAEREARLDRFLAATLAFGHTGFLVMEGGMENAVRSYFTVQQVAQQYARATASEIRYHDGQGHLLETGAALATGAYTRSQVQVRYSNGMVVTVNGNPAETWDTGAMKLPPNGWQVESKRVKAFSALVDGHRADYVDSMAYLYADGRGRFTKFERVACDGQLIVLKPGGGALELIPVGKCAQFGVQFGSNGPAPSGGFRAVALDEEKRELGPAAATGRDGMIFITPVQGAFSYKLEIK